LFYFIFQRHSRGNFYPQKLPLKEISNYFFLIKREEMIQRKILYLQNHLIEDVPV